ncbi:MAG TPA: DNA repair protein RadA [Candidatus Desulfovibrio intestinipullorum]|uniref:DNA repair protein RadA n=1 Tax=Candidatus Desulfovibrio intestinipullorum TaxID=2838536 RepID=A0A9D1PV02_9BACT|nr:DNA repair protein RadA [Candidatus Desulfovibrio intestinipullorum]
MASKTPECYICAQCGATSPQWLGRCPRCGQWNTYGLQAASAPLPASSQGQARVLRLKDAAEDVQHPFSCGLEPLDHLLGSGLVPGAVLLLGGEPGIGKSTLLLQVAGHVARLGHAVLYASGEETLAQVRARGERLNILHDNLLSLATSSCDDIVAAMHQTRPHLLILDSVQTVACTDVDGLPGNVNQVRAVATRIIEACRSLNVCAILVGHVTKDGALAGPRLLEHMVDTVLSLEGDRKQAYRLMRVFKNRFGSSEELLVFRMSAGGLNVIEDPSTFFLEDRDPSLSGTAVVMAMESKRPLAVEVQALCSRSYLTIPRRVALGFDLNRLNLLLAVLEKRLRLNFAQVDIYAKVGGGLKLTDPGLDLGLVTAILSSYYDRPLPPKALFFGEMDLNGQIRPVAGQDLRQRQAGRLGYTPIVGPGTVHTIAELAARLFGKGR